MLSNSSVCLTLLDYTLLACALKVIIHPTTPQKIQYQSDDYDDDNDINYDNITNGNDDDNNAPASTATTTTAFLVQHHIALVDNNDNNNDDAIK